MGLPLISKLETRKDHGPLLECWRVVWQVHMIAIGHHAKPAALAKYEIKMVVPGKVSQRAVEAAACKTLVRFVVLLRGE